MEDDDDLPETEVVDLGDEDDDDGVIDTPDGGAIVRLDDDEGDPRSEDFYANLAIDMSDSELSDIAQTFLDLIGKDKEARKKRDEQYEEGLRRTGLGDDAPGGAQFNGATKVVHPMLTEACIDFSSRAIKELFPPQGPVKDLIVGNMSGDKVKKAKRKTEFMNWQLTVQATEFRAELEQLLTQVPLGGAQYMKVTWNEARNRPEFLFVAIDDMYLPFAATNFYTAQRKTHVQYLTTIDYQRRVKSGMYRDVDIGTVSMEPDFSVAEKANNKIEGRNETSYNEDGLRTIFEVYTIAVIEGDEALPYIISIDKPSGKVLSIYRNWDEIDKAQEELQWFVEFPFVPWRGAYPIGLPHMVGGLAAASTGALRALLDSAHISNSQTMLKLKGGSRGGQSLEIQPTQVMEIEGGLAADDIRKLIMPLPYNPPSAVLFQLLGFLVDAGKGVIRTTIDDIADGNPNAPVGTTLAKIEQGMVVFSAIHARLHNSMQRLLAILHRLNGMYLDDEETDVEIGEELATRADFEGPLDVVPVSDPNIFSEAQRFAQVQAVAQRAAVMPQLYNQRKVEERILDTLKIPNAKDLLNPPLEPKEQNAVNENVAATMGRPIIAFPEQDHIAHLKTHLAYMMSPALGMSQLIAPTYLPGILNHIKEHIALWYAYSVFELGTEATGTDIGDMLKEIKTPEDRRAFDSMLAEASQTVVGGAADIFAAIPAVIQQAQQLLQSLAPQPQPDPNAQMAMQQLQLQAQQIQQRAQNDAQRLQLTAAQAQQKAQTDAANLQINQAKLQQQAQLDMAKMQQQAQIDQAKLQLDQAGLQLDAQQAQARLAADRESDQMDNQRNLAEMQVRQAMNTQDNLTAMELAKLEVETGERFSVSTGTGINP
jgi:chaperonin GroES